MDNKQKIKALESLIGELLSEIEDLSPCDTDCLSEELLTKIEKILPETN